MANHTAYSSINLSATIDGQKVIGLFDGDNAIQTDQSVEAGTGLVGVQGDSIFSQTADRSAMVTIRVMHTSPTHRLLLQKWEAQRAGILRPFPFDFIDAGSGDGGSGDQFFVSAAPSVAVGSKATVREWKIWTGDYKPSIPNAS